VDHDRVDGTNLNRQLVALGSTVGRLKTEVMTARVRDINPECRVVALAGFIDPDQAPDLLCRGFDHLIDAIDSLASKVALIESAWRMGIPIVASMGAGGRLDPKRLRVGDVLDTHVCPLARVVRAQLRKRGVGRGVICVWSDEPARPPLPPEDVGRGRPRAVNGTLSYMPALFGLTLAGLVVQRILGEETGGSRT
jgi:tRNA threonylcarbamoyladenosine dehydratase